MRLTRGIKAITRNYVSAFAALIALTAISSCASEHRSAPDPPKFSDILAALRADHRELTSDIRVERLAAAAGAAGHLERSPCYNLINNVNFDLQQTITNFVTSTVDTDVADLQGDINTINTDIRTFNADLNDFVNDGVLPPSGADKAISEVERKVGRTVQRAMVIIRAMRAMLRTTYGRARRLAKGRCSPHQPGSVPAIPSVSS